ncbi:MAG: hypothetical protein OXI83_14580, partial [Gemmatimonadota bacterium]|nr:hypothetical protein [Gemmatimonadota bacterium]
VTGAAGALQIRSSRLRTTDAVRADGAAGGHDVPMLSGILSPTDHEKPALTKMARFGSWVRPVADDILKLVGPTQKFNANSSESMSVSK